MKPKNLKFPFPWEQREPLLSGGVLYVPRHYKGHDLWPDDPLQTVLSSYESKAIEYCSGNGAWVAEKAAKSPDVLWIAVEKRFDRVQKIWSKMHNFSLKNLLIVCGDALEFTRYYMPAGSVDQIYINFPDPWPKLRHAKNRVIQQPFVAEMDRVLKLDSQMVLVTDDATYCSQVTDEMLKSGCFSPSYPSPYYTNEWPGYGDSYFDSLWREKGREIRYLKFFKRHEVKSFV